MAFWASCVPVRVCKEIRDEENYRRVMSCASLFEVNPNPAIPAKPSAAPPALDRAGRAGPVRAAEPQVCGAVMVNDSMCRKISPRYILAPSAQ